ncbi:MAG: penicillin-insensitive murein endopeptidase [Gammaproteobacteria bacterium]|nr:penicillin-insensitive murein endopeptidase [Gammaproteobacteria bacterium]
MNNLLLKGSLVLSIVLGFSLKAYQPENKPDNAWSAMKQPVHGQPQAYGSYANGCMVGAQVLPASGEGYVDMRRNRGRYYGQPTLIRFIQELGRHTSEIYGKKHLVGDMSQARGGRMNFGHSSHQVGLDVDIWMQTVDEHKAVNPYRDMKTIVDKAQGVLKRGSLDKPTRDALYFSATHPLVARIFVNPVVKWNLCQTERDTRWLNKIRPWWGHDQHFHVRLSCPPNSADCKNQAPPPAGDGCNDGLYNWVDEQSGLITGRIKPKKRKKSSQKRKPKVLPSACVRILTESNNEQ